LQDELPPSWTWALNMTSLASHLMGPSAWENLAYFLATSTKMFERSVGSNSILSFFEEPAPAAGTWVLLSWGTHHLCQCTRCMFWRCKQFSVQKNHSKNTREKKFDFRSYVVSHLPTMDLLIESSGIESGSVCSH
jgi:hypothetical protein